MFGSAQTSVLVHSLYITQMRATHNLQITRSASDSKSTESANRPEISTQVQTLWSEARNLNPRGGTPRAPSEHTTEDLDMLRFPLAFSFVLNNYPVTQIYGIMAFFRVSLQTPCEFVRSRTLRQDVGAWVHKETSWIKCTHWCMQTREQL